MVLVIPAPQQVRGKLWRESIRPSSRDYAEGSPTPPAGDVGIQNQNDNLKFKEKRRQAAPKSQPTARTHRPNPCFSRWARMATPTPTPARPNRDLAAGQIPACWYTATTMTITAAASKKEITLFKTSPPPLWESIFG